jgi:hypothetical protein
VSILRWGKRQQKHEEDGMEAWRQQQPGESRKEYLKRYQREYHRREYYPGHRRERVQETLDRRESLKEWYDEYKKTLRCQICGEDRPECLQFHHRDPSQKEFTIGNIIRNGVSLETLQREIAKCDVLCANCHAVIEQQKRNRNKRRSQ